VDIEEVRQHWLRAGASFADQDGVTSTSRDPHLGELERAAVLGHFPRDAEILDLGCGDGSHTVHYARAASRAVGIDYVGALLDIARARAREAGVEVDFIEASVTDLCDRFGAASFDVVISQRCLINLPSWDLQRSVLSQTFQVLRPGGLLLLTEGFSEPLEELNRLREATGLSPIAVADYNLFLGQRDFEAFAERFGQIEAVEHYGVYLTLSRVLHPLVVAPEPPRHNGRLNQIARQIDEAARGGSDFMRYSYNLLYVVRRR
jgi:ubiquinone/menaquinone biosynthesis C-methylase UbiE